MKELNLWQFESCTCASKQAKRKIHSSNTHTKSPKTNTVTSFWTYYPKIWYSKLEKTAEKGHGVKKNSLTSSPVKCMIKHTCPSCSTLMSLKIPIRGTFLHQEDRATFLPEDTAWNLNEGPS